MDMQTVETVYNHDETGQGMETSPARSSTSNGNQRHPDGRDQSAGSLVDFIASVSGEEHLKVEEDLGDGFVRLRTAEAQRRQAKHDIRGVEDIVIEMLRNARDAHATRIFLATTRDEEKSTRYLTFIDDGSGIPKHMHRLIFEPRVTSKLDSMIIDHWGVHGRGMALYSIRENTRNARVVSSDIGKGSSLFVDVDLGNLPEKRDQSTWPEIARGEEGELKVVRGPHNMIRNTLEFALEQRDIDVYFGSPTEIANVLYHIGLNEVTDAELLFNDSVEDLPVCHRLAAAEDAESLVEISTSIGLPISSRTAHRIIAGNLPMTRTVLARVRPRKADPQVDIMKDNRGLKIAKGDLDEFSISVENIFAELASKYYLSLKEMPKVTVTRDSIHIRLDIEKDE